MSRVCRAVRVWMASWVLVAAGTMAVVAVVEPAGADVAYEPIGGHVTSASTIAVQADEAVWAEATTLGDLYGYDFSTATGGVVVSASGRQDQPDVWNGWIVWRDRRWNSYDVYGQDPNGVEVEIRRDPGSQAKYPVIGGWGQSAAAVVAVWVDDRNAATTGSDIYARELETGEEFPVCTADGDQAQCAIHGQIVVWMDRRHGGYDLYGYDLAAEEEFPICVDGAVKMYPDVSDAYVVWQEGSGSEGDIVGMDLAAARQGTATKIPVCVADEGQSAARIDGALVVWEDGRDGGIDIYGRELGVGSDLAICTAGGDQRAPVVSGRRVAWLYDGQAWAGEVPVPAEIEVLGPNGGEVYRMEEEVLVTWETTGGAVPAVTLEYQVNAGPWQEIEGDVENTGSYVWRDLPSVSSPTYRVQVRDAGGTGASDESDGVFTIFACSEDLVGDLTGDCYVDGRDLAVLAGQWLTGGNPFDPDWPAGP